MNKKLIVVFGMSLLAIGAFARPHGGHFGGGHHHGYSMSHHHHHHYHGGGWWGRGGRYFWPGFIGGVVGSTIGTTLIAPRETVVVTMKSDDFNAARDSWVNALKEKSTLIKASYDRYDPADKKFEQN